MTDALIVSRRWFLKASLAAVASRISVPAFTAPRPPYVVPGESVSFVGLAKHPQPTFIGGTIVAEVEDWDGVGYPCQLHCQSFHSPPMRMAARFYDADLCNFLREGIYDQFLAARRGAPDRYFNITAFTRELRFGEDPVEYRRRQEAFMATGQWSAA